MIEIIEVGQLIPEERIQSRTVEEIVEMPVPQIHGRVVEVILQQQECLAEETVNVPVACVVKVIDVVMFVPCVVDVVVAMWSSFPVEYMLEAEQAKQCKRRREEGRKKE